MEEHVTAITICNIAKLTEPRNTYMDLLLFDEKEVQNRVKDAKPYASVTLTRLDPKVEYFADKKHTQSLVHLFDYVETVLVRKYLYDLSDIGRAMCLAIGRYPHNHLRPFMANSDETLDPFVSREHGLIFLNENCEVCYHDIGTFKKGSTNGTKQNDTSLVKDEIIHWQPQDYFGLGQTLNLIRCNERIFESKYKLRFEYLNK